MAFEHVLAALVHGSGYGRIATRNCSDRTIRCRVHAQAATGLVARLHGPVVIQYDQLIGLDLTALYKAGDNRSGRAIWEIFANIAALLAPEDALAMTGS